MDKKTRTGLLGILVTAGLTLVCGLAYALNEKINGIDIKYDYDDDDKY